MASGALVMFNTLAPLEADEAWAGKEVAQAIKKSKMA